MEDESTGYFGKHISMISRFEQIYYDKVLSPYHIGCGQQFFLRMIDLHPGISQWELSEKVCFDKGTTAKAVKKLEEKGYIIRKASKKDQRKKQLYTTSLAQPVIQATIAAKQQWRHIIMADMTKEEIEKMERALWIISNRALEYTKLKCSGGIKNGTDNQCNRTGQKSFGV